jgi:hypothetical protein
MIVFSRITLQDAAEKLAFMQGNPKWDTSGGNASIQEQIGQGAAFVASDSVGDLAIFAISKTPWANGIDLVVRVAHQMSARRDLTREVLPLIEKEFGRDCDSVTIYTKRGGLVKKLESCGYVEQAKIMQKRLKNGRR